LTNAHCPGIIKQYINKERSRDRSVNFFIFLSLPSSLTFFPTHDISISKE